MLSIAKLRVGQEAYHLSGVAQSLDDYYTGAGEAAGHWVGGGADRLGLHGEVDADDLRVVLAGIAPRSGGLDPNGNTIRPSSRRVPGFDLTFKLPKTASVLYAVSDDPRVQGAIIDAGETAVREALAWLEREAIRAQRGSHNKVWLDKQYAMNPGDAHLVRPRRIATSGVVGAAFRHRTSRAGDPLLHWHVLVANLVEGADGRWSAFAHPEIYRAARTAGEIFQAVVRRELAARIGVEWRPGRHVQEIAGIPERIVEMFSKRRAEIEAWLATTGRADTPRTAQTATLATRRGKPELEGERLDNIWKREAIDAGWGPQQAEELIGVGRSREQVGELGELWRLPAVVFDEDGSAVAHERVVDAEEWITSLLRGALTQTSTTFTRFEVTQAVAARLGEGATVVTIDRITNRILASDQVVAVHESDRPAPRGRARYTSREILAVEARLLDAITTTATHPALPPDIVAAAITTHPTIGDDQAAAVATLCAADGPIAVLVGPAGTGKTFTLDTVAAAYRTAGYDVIGAAPSARAAVELHSGAGIPSWTLHKLLAVWERGIERPHAGTVLVIDEAGMADIRILDRVIGRVRAAGGRVVLVGDHHQLPEIDAGGGFAAGVSHNHAVAQLTVNRRQHEPWEQDALSELRAGNVPTAVHAYIDHDRVLVADDRQHMVEVAVDAWFHARREGRHVVLLAGTNELVDVLNDAARNRLVAAGELPAEIDGHYGNRGYRVGERVVLRRNSDHARTLDDTLTTVANGHTGTITHLDDGTMTIRRDDDDALITIDRRYLDHGGRVDHAYALTTTRAQGGTWDQAIAVGLDGLYREAAYVDLSRGQAMNMLVITGPEAERIDVLARDPLDRHDAAGIPLPSEEPGDIDTEIVDTVERSGAKQLAHTIDPHVAAVDSTARSRPLDQLETRLQYCRTIERHANELIGIDADQLAGALDRAEHVAHHVAIHQRVKPFDRFNVGTVVGIDDTHGSVTLHFESPNGTTATKTFAWTELWILDPHPQRRELSEPAQRRLDQLHHAAEAALTTRRRHLAEHGVQPDEADITERAIRRVIEQATHHLIAEQPAWLIDLCSYQPDDPIGTQTWTALVRDIATWRARHHINADQPGLGTPTTSDDHDDWTTLNRRLLETRAWLEPRDRPQIIWPQRRSHHELLDRRDELETIFATAPRDQTPLIDRLRRGDPQLINDITATLKSAIDTQQTRRSWILEHWPHIIEYTEITQTIDAELWGPDTTTLLDDLHDRAHGALAQALDNTEPWLPIAVARLAPQWATTLTTDAVDYLHDIADYRHHWNITSHQPLGPRPLDHDAVDDHQLLLDRLEQHDLDRTPTSPTLDDYLDRQLDAIAVLDRADDSGETVERT